MIDITLFLRKKKKKKRRKRPFLRSVSTMSSYVGCFYSRFFLERRKGKMKEKKGKEKREKKVIINLINPKVKK